MIRIRITGGKSWKFFIPGAVKSKETNWGFSAVAMLGFRVENVLGVVGYVGFLVLNSLVVVIFSVVVVVLVVVVVVEVVVEVVVVILGGAGGVGSMTLKANSPKKTPSRRHVTVEIIIHRCCSFFSISLFIGFIPRRGASYAVTRPETSAGVGVDGERAVQPASATGPRPPSARPIPLRRFASLTGVCTLSAIGPCTGYSIPTFRFQNSAIDGLFDLIIG